MRRDPFRLRLLLASATLCALAGGALADFGQPSPWQLGFQTANSEGSEYVHWFHDLLLWIITAITLFVLGLLVYVAWRFNEKKHPTPSRTTHNSLLEVARTVIKIKYP